MRVIHQVSIHAPTGDARSTDQGLTFEHLFQSTRLRETREAVSTCLSAYLEFQSTRLRETRAIKVLRLATLKPSFNPRAYGRREITSRQISKVIRSRFQSTRLRETRDLTPRPDQRSTRFQSTRLRETRDLALRHLQQLGGFQSTRLRETRASFTSNSVPVISFNPRAYGRREDKQKF